MAAFPFTLLLFNIQWKKNSLRKFCNDLDTFFTFSDSNKAALHLFLAEKITESSHEKGFCIPSPLITNKDALGLSQFQKSYAHGNANKHISKNNLCLCLLGLTSFAFVSSCLCGAGWKIKVIHL